MASSRSAVAGPMGIGGGGGLRGLGSLLTASILAGTAPLAAQSPLSGRWDHVALPHDALHYDIAVTLPDTGSLLRARVTARWRLGSGVPVVLDLDSVFRVQGVSIEGRAARWRREGNTVVIPLSGEAGPEVTTSIEYQGVPSDGLVIRGRGATRTIFADNWPDRGRSWLAVQDHPADKATVGWRIEAPAGYVVVANGALIRVDTLDGGSRRWSFASAEPVPTYTMVLGMARLATTVLRPGGCRVRCVPVSVVAYPGDSAFAVDGPFRRASEIVDFFSERIAPFPYAELRHVQSSTRFGGMENATVIFYDEKGYRSRTMGEGVVAHETAHQWFGDAVTEADWHHLWLSEGFATYGAALWSEHLGGDSALRATMRNAGTAVFQSTVTERPILDSTVTDRLQLLNTNNYPKAAWVLHSLRGLIGDSAFFQGLRSYYRTYEHRNALSSDFARIISAEAKWDLQWYFTQALTQPGYPVLEVSTGVDAGHLLLTVRQVQKAAWGLFRLPNLEVRLDDRVLTVDVYGAITKVATHWVGDAPPKLVTVDPAGWWLLKATVIR